MESLKQVAEEAATGISNGALQLDVISKLVNYPLKPEMFSFPISDDESVTFYQRYLFGLVQQLIKGYLIDDIVPMSLIMRVIDKGKSDVVFTCLFDHLVNGTVTKLSKFHLLANAFEALIFQYHRLPLAFRLISTQGSNLTENKLLLEDFSKSLVSLPSRMSNVCCGPLALKLFNKEAFVDVILSSITKSNCSTELFGTAASHLILSGYASEVSSFFLSNVHSGSSDEKDFYGSSLRFIKPDCIEPLVFNMLRESRRPDYIKIILRYVFRGPVDPVSNCFLKVFRRIIFVRHFKSDILLRNLFGALSGIFFEQPDANTYLLNKVNDDLGYPVARLWADPVSIQRTSVEHRLYISQAFASWFTDFYRPVMDSFPSNTDHHDLLSDILFGIGNHLACTRPEIRSMGMAFGECILKVFPYKVNSDDVTRLKFDYEDTDLVRAVKMSFVSLPAANPKEEIPISSMSVQDQSKESEILRDAGSNGEVIDSDDDLEDTTKVNDLLPRLQSYVKCDRKSAVMDTHKPRYLRECLDGMLLSKTEDNCTRLICFAAASDLIREHPGTARELVFDIAGALLHSEPAISSNEISFAESRHSALVALGTVAPKDCSRFLINEFTQSTCSFVLRQTILTVLTDVACELSNVSIRSLGNKEDYSSLGIASRPSTQHCHRHASNSRLLPKHSVNTFISVAGDFFFPLLNSVSQLHSASQKGYFAHQDVSILTQLIATLGIICACAHSSPIQWRMTHELLELLPIIYRHLDPTVRQSCLLALGTVITTIPSFALFSDNPFDSHMLSNLMEWLERCCSYDTDDDCKALASVTLSALMDKAREAMPKSIMSCN